MAAVFMRGFVSGHQSSRSTGASPVVSLLQFRARSFSSQQRDYLFFAFAFLFPLLDFFSALERAGFFLPKIAW